MGVGESLPEAWLKLTPEQMKKLRRNPAASTGAMMGQIESLTGYPIREMQGNFYVQLPPNGGGRWNPNITPERIEQVFTHDQMAVNVEDLRTLWDEHYEDVWRKTEEQKEEAERLALKEQLLAAQQEEMS